MPAVLWECDPHSGGLAVLFSAHIPLHSCSPHPCFHSGESASRAGKGDVPPGGLERWLVGCLGKRQGMAKYGRNIELSSCSGEAERQRRGSCLLGLPTPQTPGRPPECPRSVLRSKSSPICFSLAWANSGLSISSFPPLIWKRGCFCRGQSQSPPPTPGHLLCFSSSPKPTPPPHILFFNSLFPTNVTPMFVVGRGPSPGLESSRVLGGCGFRKGLKSC